MQRILVLTLALGLSSSIADAFTLSAKRGPVKTTDIPTAPTGLFAKEKAKERNGDGAGRKVGQFLSWAEACAYCKNTGCGKCYALMCPGGCTAENISPNDETKQKCLESCSQRYDGGGAEDGAKAKCEATCNAQGFGDFQWFCSYEGKSPQAPWAGTIAQDRCP